jgi:hypothetical protein
MLARLGPAGPARCALAALIDATLVLQALDV